VNPPAATKILMLCLICKKYFALSNLTITEVRIKLMLNIGIKLPLPNSFERSCAAVPITTYPALLMRPI